MHVRSPKPTFTRERVIGTRELSANVAADVATSSRACGLASAADMHRKPLKPVSTVAVTSAGWPWVPVIWNLIVGFFPLNDPRQICIARTKHETHLVRAGRTDTNYVDNGSGHLAQRIVDGLLRKRRYERSSRSDIDGCELVSVSSFEALLVFLGIDSLTSQNNVPKV